MTAGIFAAVVVPWMVAVVVTGLDYAVLLAGRGEPFARRAARRQEAPE